MIDYNSIESLTPEEFAEATLSQEDLAALRVTESDDEDRRKIERFLDVREGTLVGLELYLEYAECPNGHVLKPSDLVLTGLVDANHSKSFMLHTLIGTKLIVNRPRRIRCSRCGGQTDMTVGYGKPGNYGCTK